MKRLWIIIITVITILLIFLASLYLLHEQFIEEQNRQILDNPLVKDCIPSKNKIVPAMSLSTTTHVFDPFSCTWSLLT